MVGTPLPWDDWIFTESKSRTAILYFIFGMFFNLEFRLPCDRDFDSPFAQIDLPAAKSLWTAIDTHSWREEYDFLKSGSEAKLRYGELQRFNELVSRPGGQSSFTDEENTLARRVARWEENMDGFSMLVSLCSTME